ncbi:hypothetical protein SAMN03159496_05633 [Rhizobium sp. NFR07]|uniref:hypothetical protein n=1 Tax=Rhizobium sp. NFR07 TaxID=1566262 RepID=UPI0008EF0D68|nr:hypothetical protein [Rhizobium sp. NFR07]SFB60085.1 hypothetical protein SAMN03159496_05633 [Rhizobium sp. NFR07]
MNPSQEMLSKATTAEDKVQSIMGEALGCLQSGFNGQIVIGFGVHANSSSRHQDLNTA